MVKKFDKAGFVKGIKPFYPNKSFSLYRGNSIKFLKNISEDSTDMIFADPPYNLSNGGFSVHVGKKVSINKG